MRHMSAFQFGRRMRIKLANEPYVDLNQHYSVSSSRGTPLISPRGPSLTLLQQPAAPPTPAAPEPPRIMPLGVARSEPEPTMSISLPGAPPKPQPPFQPSLMLTGQSSPRAARFIDPTKKESPGLSLADAWRQTKNDISMAYDDLSDKITPYVDHAAKTYENWKNPGYNSHTGLGTYADVVDRWYNPVTEQEVKERGETGLMRTGQVALGTAALAGGTAAAITAAPALGFGGAGAGSTAAGTGTGLAAASQTPAAQNFMQRLPQFAQSAQTFQNRVMPRINSVYDTMQRWNYSPENALNDVAAVGTGNFDQIRGPGWSGRLSMLNAPSTPFPAGSGTPYPIPSPVGLYRRVANAARPQ